MNETLEFLQKLFPGAGHLNMLQCDNGTAFTGTEIIEILNEYGMVTIESPTTMNITDWRKGQV